MLRVLTESTTMLNFTPWVIHFEVTVCNRDIALVYRSEVTLEVSILHGKHWGTKG